MEHILTIGLSDAKPTLHWTEAPAASAGPATPTTPATPPPLPSSVVQAQTAGLDETVRTQLQELVITASQHLKRLESGHDEQAHVEECRQLQTVIQSLEGFATSAGLPRLTRQAAAMDAFLKELSAKPSHLNDSRQRTLTLAVEVMAQLVRHPKVAREQPAELVAMIVDAEHVSCTAASNALRSAGFHPLVFGDPTAALGHLEANRVDLIVLDPATAAQSGLDLYSQLRQTPLHQETPVIFISNRADTKCPAGMLLGSETQFLGKPYNMMSYHELALKALSRVLKRQTDPEDGDAQSSSGDDPASEPIALDDESSQTETPALEPSVVSTEQAPVAEVTAATPEAAPSPFVPDHSPVHAQVAPEPRPEAEQQAEGAKSPRVAQLETELASLWQMCDELNRNLEAERKTVAESQKRHEDLEARLRERDHKEAVADPDVERRVRESAASSARAGAELEKERAERRRVEQRANSLATQLQDLHGQLKQHLESGNFSQTRLTDLEQQLREREESLTRVTADLDKERVERQMAEEQLRASGDLSAHLRNCLASFEAAKQSYKRTQDQLESRLKESLSISNESGARLQKETSDRQRAEDALTTAQRALQEQSQQSALEISKLQSALEVEQAERRRIEGDAIQSRYASLDSARVGVTTGNKLRRQLREPVENLMQATRRLLESPIEEGPKKLVETVLENALLLQSNLQELGTSTNAAPQGSPQPGATPAVAVEPKDAQGSGDQHLAAA